MVFLKYVMMVANSGVSYRHIDIEIEIFTSEPMGMRSGQKLSPGYL